MNKLPQKFKTVLSKFFNTLIYSNLWVALSSGSITYAIFLINDLEINYDIISLNVCLTFLSYNYIYLIGNKTNPQKMETHRKRWMNNNRLLSFTFLVSAIIYVSVQLYYLSSFQWIILFSLSIISFLYLLPDKKSSGLRWLPGLKIILISASWATLIIPFSFNLFLPLSVVVVHLILVFLFVIALAIPFDLRDIENDSATLRTIPQLIGSKYSIRLSQLIFSLIGILLIIKTNQTQLQAIHLFFTMLSIIIIEKSLNRKIFYYNFWVEGLPFFWLVGLLIVGK